MEERAKIENDMGNNSEKGLKNKDVYDSTYILYSTNISKSDNNIITKLKHLAIKKN